MMKRAMAILMVAVILTTSFIIRDSDGSSDDDSYAPSSLVDSSWPLFRGNLNRTGQSPYSTALCIGLLWKFGTGGAVVSSPAIGPDGTIYFGSNDGYFYAINKNGTLKWKYNTGYPVKSSPALADDSIYVGAGPSLYAFTYSGTLRWRFSTAYTVVSSPAVGDDGTIYFLDSDSTLYAVRLDGSQKWRYSFFTDNPNLSTGSPAVASDGTIYVCVPDPYDNAGEDYIGHLFALTPSGSQIFDYQTGGDVGDMTPAIGPDGTIYFHTRSGVMPFGEYDDYIIALYSDGTEKWKYQVFYDDVYIGTGGTPPVVSSSGKVYFGAGDTLFVADSTGVSEIHDFVYDIPLSPPSISSNGRIWLGCDDGSLYGLGDGNPICEYSTGNNWMESSPAISEDGGIYVGTNDGYLYAFYDPRIRIYNNTDFAEKAAIYGWTGDGSENNPYIIDNIHIDLQNVYSSDGEAVYVRDTDVHFIIKNCTFEKAVAGIYIYNVTNSLIENNTIMDCNVGIEIIQCHSGGNLIRNNTVTDSGTGIYIYYSDFNIVSYNNISGTDNHGLRMYDSDRNEIHNNMLSWNSEGMELDEFSRYNNIKYNLFFRNTGYAIYIVNNDPFFYNTPPEYTIAENVFLYNRGSLNSYNSSHIQAYAEVGGNYWDVNGRGNYWLDWAKNNETNDMDGDGIVDWPYKITGSRKDMYPLKSPPMPIITVKKGWNLVSLYWQTNEEKIEKIFSGIQWDRAATYLNGTWQTCNSNRAKKYNIGFPSLDSTMGLWINSQEESFILGNVPNITERNITLHRGWNLVGYPSNTLRNVSTALSGIPYVYVETYDFDTGEIIELTGDSMMEPGSGYWIYVTEDCVWTVEW